MKNIRPIVITLLLLHSGLLTAVEKSYTINTAFETPISDVLKSIVLEAFDRINKKIEFEEMPAERSIRLVNDGIDDGECCRIQEINKKYPNLLSVPVELIRIDFSAFSKNTNIKITNIHALAPYEIAIVSGWKILETIFLKFPPKKLYTVNTPQSLFGMLDKGRIDIVVIGRFIGHNTIQKMKLRNIHIIEPPIASRPLFLFLHKKNKNLIAPLKEVLISMQSEGVIAQHYDKMMNTSTLR